MGRLGHAALNVKMKHGLGSTAFLCESPPSSVAIPRGAIAMQSIANKIDIHTIGICRPMQMEVIKEVAPIQRKMVHFKITQWKRKSVVDPNNRGWSLLKCYR
jgi:hypothetical protein